MLKIGEPAPDFSLLDQDGQTQSLKDQRGKWLLIYFYPKDDTPGCTKEACSMRDNLTSFGQLNLTVFGVSADSVKSHKKFADKFNLNFPILADEQKDMVKSYGVWMMKKFMGREYLGINRTSFLIDPQGKIAKIYEKVKPEGHAQEVAADLLELQK